MEIFLVSVLSNILNFEPLPEWRTARERTESFLIIGAFWITNQDILYAFTYSFNGKYFNKVIKNIFQS